jgi:hypothetical protein
MSGEIRRLEISIVTTDTDRQQAHGIPEIHQLTHHEITEELATHLDEALKRWYVERGHRYLEIEPETFTGEPLMERYGCRCNGWYDGCPNPALCGTPNGCHCGA